MPRGPQGQKRPADVIGNAVHIARIATGEEQETTLTHPAKARERLGRGEGASREHHGRGAHGDRTQGCYGEVGVMPAPYSSVAVANTFIEKFGSISGIEHMKLQKLVYCSYGWWLTYYGLDGIKLTEDGPEIWRHGPVFPELYQAFKVFGRKPITTIKSDGPFSAA